MSIARSSQPTQEYIDAKLVDVHLLTQHQALAEWIRDLANESTSTSHQLTLEPQAGPNYFERALQVLIENFIKHQCRFLALSKSWGDYPAASRYQRNPIPLSAIIAATEFLRDKGWIYIHPGSAQAKLRTRLEATPEFQKILSEGNWYQIKITTAVPDETIILRDHQRALVNYEDTQKTIAIRRNLHAINSFLAKHLVQFESRRLNTHLVRIFKNSFLEGGRFYRAEHLSLNSKERQEIKINGEAVTEIDFSCLHVNMLYIRETGMPLKEDAYETANSPLPKELARDIYKIVLQIILNAENETSALLAVKELFQSKGLQVSPQEALKTFLDKHKPIRKYFFSGIGLKLQYEDSVIAESVLLKAVRKNVPLLPVHDSFLVPSEHAAWLQTTMAETCIEVLGAALPVKIKTKIVPPAVAA